MKRKAARSKQGSTEHPSESSSAWQSPGPGLLYEEATGKTVDFIRYSEQSSGWAAFEIRFTDGIFLFIEPVPRVQMRACFPRRCTGDSGTLTWPSTAVYVGPPLGSADSTLFLSDLRGGGRVGLESQGGVIRADTSGVRVWRWVGDRCGAEAGCASAHGSGGGAERSSGATEMSPGQSNTQACKYTPVVF
jgi:hypothetical protein